MSMNHRRTLRRFWLSAAVLSGCTFQFGWVPSCRGLATTVNPCGTVFAFCQASDIDLLFSGIPNWELDPTCTIPGFGYGAVDTEFPTGVSGGCASQPVFPSTPGIRPGGQP